MSRTSKSPRTVALEALSTAREALPRYSSRFSRHDFTLAQHFACLVLKSFFRTDYRGIAAILQDLPELCAALALKKVPHFTTLQKAHARLLSFGPTNQLLDVTVRRALGERPRVEMAAGDSTGLEASQISPYFVKRRSPKRKAAQVTTYTRYGEAGGAVRLPHARDPLGDPDAGPAPRCRPVGAARAAGAVARRGDRLQASFDAGVRQRSQAE